MTLNTYLHVLLSIVILYIRSCADVSPVPADVSPARRPVDY